MALPRSFVQTVSLECSFSAGELGRRPLLQSLNRGLNPKSSHIQSPEIQSAKQANSNNQPAREHANSKHQNLRQQEMSNSVFSHLVWSVEMTRLLGHVLWCATTHSVRLFQKGVNLAKAKAALSNGNTT